MTKKILLIAVLLLATVYGAGVVYSTVRFLPNTYVEGIRLDGQNLEKKATVRANDPVISVIQKNKDTGEPLTEKIDLGKEANYEGDYNVKELLNAQNKFAWFMSFFQKNEITGVKQQGFYNKNKLYERAGELYCAKEENIVRPVDAHIVKSENGLAIEKENDGCYVDRETLENSLWEAVGRILNGEKVDSVDLSEKYAVAEIKEDNAELLKQLEACNKIVSKTVTVKISDSKSETISGTALLDLLDVKDNTLQINSAKLNDLVDGIYASNKVSNYEYINVDKLKESLTGVLLSDRDASVEASWIKITPPVSKPTTSVNDSIEVDISEQTLYYYVDDVLQWTSPVVTGRPGVTPLGHFKVTKIDGHSVLSGPTWEEYVDYWIGFDPTGVHKGFHDASWRSEFGGDIYLTDPSHGCVNMPTNMVAKLHSLVHIGTPVYIHE